MALGKWNDDTDAAKESLQQRRNEVAQQRNAIQREQQRLVDELNAFFEAEGLSDILKAVGAEGGSAKIEPAHWTVSHSYDEYVLSGPDVADNGDMTTCVLERSTSLSQLLENRKETLLQIVVIERDRRPEIEKITEKREAARQHYRNQVQKGQWQANAVLVIVGVIALSLVLLLVSSF